MTSEVVRKDAAPRSRGRVVAALRRDSSATLAVILIGSVLAYLGVRYLTDPQSIDLVVYRVEGQAIRSHTYLYGSLPTPQDLRATYPPFAAVLFAVLTWVPSVLLPWVGLSANLGLLLVVAVQSCRLAGVDPARVRQAAVVLFALTLFSEPVLSTLRNGQINLFLLALLLWDFTRPPGSRWMGVGIGLAAGIKVTPAIFIGYLVLTRRFRAAATATLTFLLSIAASALLLPREAREYWTRLLFDTSRVGPIEKEANQTLIGFLARLQHSRVTPTVGSVAMLVLAVAGLACAVLAYRRLGDRWGVPACAVTTLVATPIAWTHHWVWIVPIAVLLWRDSRYWVIPLAALFWSYVVWLLPHGDGAELQYSPGQLAASSPYLGFGAAFLALTAYRAWQEPGRLRQLEPGGQQWGRA